MVLLSVLFSVYHVHILVLVFKYLFIYIFLAVLGLRCCAQTF